jgi:hypothetical protein
MVLLRRSAEFRLRATASNRQPRRRTCATPIAEAPALPQRSDGQRPAARTPNHLGARSPAPRHRPPNVGSKRTAHESEAELRAVFDAVPSPRFDTVLLGVG